MAGCVYQLTEVGKGDQGILCASKMLKQILKVPKCDIFDSSDFIDFYTIKSSWVGESVVKILTCYFNFWGS
jgi:hypothetical protein